MPGDATSHTRIRSFGLFTGQIGYAWNNALLYVKGGAAVTDNRYEHRVVATNAVFDSVSNTRWGGTVGAGIRRLPLSFVERGVDDNEIEFFRRIKTQNVVAV